MYWLTSKLNSTDRKEESHPEILKSDSLNVPKFFLRLSLRALNSLAISPPAQPSPRCLSDHRKFGNSALYLSSHWSFVLDHLAFFTLFLTLILSSISAFPSSVNYSKANYNLMNLYSII